MSEVGNVQSITDPVGNTTRYVYDARSRVTQEINEALAESRFFTYDDLGNRTSTTDRNGRVRAFEYDGLNRQTEEQWLDEAGNPVRVIASTYDAANQLVAVTDPEATYHFGYDPRGRLVTVDTAGTPGLPHVVLTYAYDNEGNPVAVSDTINGIAGGTTTYAYDELDRVSQIVQTGNEVADKRVDFTYDAIGQYDTISRYADLNGTH